MKRAVLVVLTDGPDPDKQIAVATAHCAAHRLQIVSLLHGDPGAAVPLIEAGLIDVIVVAAPDHAGLTTAAAAAAQDAGGEVQCARVRRTQAPRTAVNPAIERALARGLEPETVAEILDVSIDAVLEALTAKVPGPVRTTLIPAEGGTVGRRPREITHPAGRR